MVREDEDLRIAPDCLVGAIIQELPRLLNEIILVYSPTTNTILKNAVAYFIDNTQLLPDGTNSNKKSVNSISNWDVSSITDFSNAFATGYPDFNSDISQWNMSNATNTRALFFSCESFNQNIGNWDMSNVTDIDFMFAVCSSFNQDIGNWNLVNVTSAQGVFASCTAFNQTVGNWNMSKVTNMISMFQDASSFDQNIGSWDTSNVTKMAYMFKGASIFFQDIRIWNVSNVDVNYPGGGFTGMFEGATRMLNAYPQLATSDGIVEWFASSDGGIFIS